MEVAIIQVATSVHHMRFSIFDWSIPNLIVGAIIIVVFFVGAWIRLPTWIEHEKEKRR